MTGFVTLTVADIGTGARQRPVRPAVAAAYAEAFRAGAALPPILVRPAEGLDTPFLLVAGGHRLEGARLAGMETILAEVRDLSDDEATIAEAEENLVRAQLGFLDRAVALAAHKAAYERLHPETAKGKWSREAKFRQKQEKLKGQTLPLSDQPFDETPYKTFSQAAAEALDLSPRTIKDAITLLSRLDPEAVRILQPHKAADRRGDVERLAEFPAERQRHMARLIAEGKAESVRDAIAFETFETKPINHNEATERGLLRFQDWLTRAPAKHADLTVEFCARPLAEAFRRRGWTLIPPDGGQS